MTRRSIPFAVLVVGYLLVVGLITFGPTPWRTVSPSGDEGVLSLSTWLDPETWRRMAAPEFVANILLFVPLGMLLRLAIPRATWVGAGGIGAAISFVIEVLQVATPRVSDPRDVVANTIGAATGALLAALIAGVVRIGRRGIVRRGIDRGMGRVVSRPADRHPVG